MQKNTKKPLSFSLDQVLFYFRLYWSPIVQLWQYVLQWCDDDDENIEYISTVSSAQAIFNICNFQGMYPTDSASGVDIPKSDILEI